MKVGFNWILPRKSIEGVKQTIGILATWEYAFDAGSTINPFLSSRNPPFHLPLSLSLHFPLLELFVLPRCIRPGCDCRFPVWNFRLCLRANSTARRATFPSPTNWSIYPLDSLTDNRSPGAINPIFDPPISEVRGRGKIIEMRQVDRRRDSFRKNF